MASKHIGEKGRTYVRMDDVKFAPSFETVTPNHESAHDQERYFKDHSGTADGPDLAMPYAGTIQGLKPGAVYGYFVALCQGPRQ